MVARRLVGLLADADVLVRLGDGKRDWRCIECGLELADTARPTVCPHCNCSDGDVPPEYPLFLRAEAMEAEPGLVTGLRQFREVGSA